MYHYRMRSAVTINPSDRRYFGRVEDDPMNRMAVSVALKDAPYVVDWVRHAAAAKSALATNALQGVLLAPSKTNVSKNLPHRRYKMHQWMQRQAIFYRHGDAVTVRTCVMSGAIL